MTKRERVLAAIRHQQPDRVPKGEMLIESGLIDALLAGKGADALSPLMRQIEVRKLLGIDLISIHEYPMQLVRYTSKGWPVYRGAYGEEFCDTGRDCQLLKPAIEDIEDADTYKAPAPELCRTTMLDFYRENSDLFLMTQINGPIGALTWAQGMEEMCVDCMTDLEATVSVAEQIMDFEILRAKQFLDHGADAILIADDMAFNTGLILPPQVMDKLAWPIYARLIRQIKAHKDVPVFLHTDGNINSVLDKIVACGFDGLQSLQPSAGMDIVQVKKQYGEKLCLMGNLDLNHLLPFGTPEDVAAEVRRIVSACSQSGGFILSTCNILTNAVPPENALAMYRAAE